MNLFELLSCNCSLTSDEISQILQQSPETLFIIDGFDELRLTQDIYDMSAHIHPLQKAPPDVILCGLLRGILPESLLLVTTKTNDTVSKLVKGQKRFIEIMGFYVMEVVKYFIKPYYSVTANESLFAACSIPVICRIISERVKLGAVTSGLETTTSIYVDFVSTLLEHHCQDLNQSVLSLLKSLGQLAERGMLEQQVMFNEKSLYKLDLDPAGSPFLCRFLFKRIIRQETMFSFMHLSFQEFFTALYYVLLDEKESQREMRELLRTVQRGWALSSWSHKDFSVADVEITRAKLLQPVILFLCGFCKKEWIPSFFQKHNMAVSISIETQLKEWINQCAWRYQNEHMLFILHCLYELHEKSFIAKVLEGLVVIDLSNTPLKMTDCWVLKYCLQCCEQMENLKLHVTPDNLKILQPDLCRCKELCGLEEEEVRLLRFLESVSGLKKVCLQLSNLTNTLADQVLSLIQACPSLIEFSGLEEEEVRLLRFLESVSGLKKVCLQLSNLTNTLADQVLSLIQACPSLIEFRFLCPHAGQFRCSLTNLVFVMENKGKSEVFECNKFSQNYHPMFEVFLNVNIEEIRLGVLDKTKDGKEVWNRRRILLTAPSQGVEPHVQRRLTESEFVNKHREELIQRVLSVMAIADCLKRKNMISSEMYSKVHAAEPRQEKMRLLLDALDSGGAAVKAEFYRLLKENEPHLVDDLESGLSRPH
ncbi:LRR and PYD domains-containing 3-like protein [Labeo rohita]|uniref:LRR and PYD domains-containing 3-like protein n=1 Tax=Labeo rohita TaxID=84645 RepID=A0A498M6L8_LABRO|nr:LRR and PYD domains-containing 3-like protein [Labeo rohita]